MEIISFLLIDERYTYHNLLISIINIVEVFLTLLRLNLLLHSDNYLIIVLTKIKIVNKSCVSHTVNMIMLCLYTHDLASFIRICNVAEFWKVFTCDLKVTRAL